MKRILLFFSMVLMAVQLSAYDFAEGGIYYALKAPAEVSVVAGETHYEGVLAIPAEVQHGGATYQVTSVGEKAFYDCTSLVKVTLPATMKSIADFAFAGCTAMVGVNFPEGLQAVGQAAFYGCSALYTIHLPASLTTIGDEAFACCGRLSAFTVSEGNTSYTAVAGVLMNIDKTRLIAYPNRLSDSYAVPSGVVEIGNWAFLKCRNLHSISFPQGLRVVGNAAFYGCSALQSVAFPGSVETIGVWAFSECEQLTTVTLGDHVASIGSGSFSFCQRLQTIRVSGANAHYTTVDGSLLTKDQRTLLACPGGKSGSYRIPTTVEALDSQAFYGCNALQSVILTAQLSDLGTNPFLFCDNLTEILVSNDHPDFSSQGGVLLNKEQTAILFYPNAKSGSYTIPAGITTLQSGPFMRSRLLTSLSIPKGVTTIGNWTFMDCEGLQAVSLPPTLSTLGDRAFDCPSLKTVFCGAVPMATTAFDAADRRQATLYMPQGGEDAFYQTEGWGTFAGYRSFGVCAPVQTGRAGEPLDITLSTTGGIRLSELELDFRLPAVVELATAEDGSYSVATADGLTGTPQCSRNADGSYHLSLQCNDQREVGSDADALLCLTVNTSATAGEAVYDMLLQNVSFSYAGFLLTGSAVQPDQTVALSFMGDTALHQPTAATTRGAVYNLQGLQVRRAGESLKGLPAGVYIVDGKKIVLR